MPENFMADLVNAVVAFLLFFATIFILIIVLVLRYRKRKRENEELRVQFSEQLLQSRLEMREQTLQNVSRELHDNIGQVASLVKINLNSIGYTAGPEAQQQITDTKEMLKQMMTDIKMLSTSLNGDRVAKMGLMNAIQQESEKIAATNIFESQFTQEDNIPPVDDEKTIILFRMMQELLNNAIKYSEGTQINIEARYQKNNLILSVTDNGKGFDVQQKLKDSMASGNGLINLQQRAKAINANISFYSKPGEGTKCEIKMAL